jgi:hypothetical protein
MNISYFNFLKFVIRGEEQMTLLVMELFLSGRFFLLPHITAVWLKDCADKQNEITKSRTLHQFA